MRRRFSIVVYRKLLRVLPADFTTTYGSDLEAEFEHRLADYRPWGMRFYLLWVAALLDLGLNVVRLRRISQEPSESTRVRSTMEQFANDLLYGVRSLKRTPVSTAVVVITLALGIGATSSMFGVLNSVVFRPLDYPKSERIFLVEADWPATETIGAPQTGRDYQFLRANSRAFEALASVFSVRQNLAAGGVAEQVEAGWATADFFDVFGAEPIIGRQLRDDDESGTAVLSYALWQSSFGSDADIVGRSISLDGRPVVVVGVLPPTFAVTLPARAGLPARVDLWRTPDHEWSNGDLWDREQLEAAVFRVVGRAAPGMGLDQLNTELATLAGELRRIHDDHATAGFELYATPLLEAVVGPSKATLYALFGAVGLVFLISCANVASILLVKANSRQREMAVRAALGSGRARIMRQVLSESLLLALAGGAGGITLAYWGTGLVRAISPDGLPRVGGVGVDVTVLTFALAVAVFSTFLFGTLPALIGARANPIDALQSSSRSVARSTGVTGTIIVGGEIAMAVVLLLGTGLLLRAMSELERVSPGFEFENLLTYSVSLPSQSYAAPEGTHAFFRDFLDASTGVPGVESAAVVWPLPLEGQWWYGRYNAPENPEEAATANLRVVSPGYFDVIGTNIVDGRSFAEGDAREVAVVSRALAEKEWPGQAAVGRMIHASPWGGGGTDFRVVGVADDVRYQSLREPEIPTIYFSTEGWGWSDWEFGVVARTTVEAMTVVPALKALLAEMDGTLPLARPVPMADYVEQQLATNRFVLTLFAVFAALAILMAAIGIYGVIAHSVSQRTREIGIRLALGAESSTVQRLVVRQGLRVILAGVLAGVAVAAFATKFIGSLLYGVHPLDLLTYATIATAVIGVGLVATFIPTRRVALIDPAETLRAE